MNDVFNFSPKLWVFVSFEHLVGSGVCSDSVANGGEVYGEGKSNCQ